jgi:3-dehydroquinate dehydratase-2
MKVLIINGPNLNLLGTREPSIYGTATLEEVGDRCRALGAEHGLEVEFLQSNYEGQIVEWIHEAIDSAQALVINAAAYTHTSVAIHDALKSYHGYKIELHISNPHLRESFRHISFVSPVVDAVVAGFGVGGYSLVVEHLNDVLQEGALTRTR